MTFNTIQWSIYQIIMSSRNVNVTVITAKQNVSNRTQMRDQTWQDWTHIRCRQLSHWTQYDADFQLTDEQ